MYLGKKASKKPRSLGQKIGGAIVGLGTKIGTGVLTQLVAKQLPKLLL
jgi:hypothetical protein